MDTLTRTEFRSMSGIDASYNRPNNYMMEGEDHLNISIQSSSPVGRILDPGYCANFEYPHLGRFKSILALTYWLKSPTKDDAIRMLKGYKLKKYISDNNLHGKRLPNYHAILAKATWIRISARKDIIDKVKSLPENIELLSYHTDRVSNVRITTNYAKTAVAISSEILAAIREEREPDFDMFVTEPEFTGRVYLDGILNP